MTIQVWGGDKDSQPNLHGKHVFDATPWFEQATNHQLNMLRNTLVPRDRDKTEAFCGGYVFTIMQWLVIRGFIPAEYDRKSLDKYCQQWFDNTRNYGTFLAWIEPSDVLQWQATQTAKGAVDTLLGGD